MFCDAPLCSMCMFVLLPCRRRLLQHFVDKVRTVLQMKLCALHLQPVSDVCSNACTMAHAQTMALLTAFICGPFFAQPCAKNVDHN